MNRVLIWRIIVITACMLSGSVYAQTKDSLQICCITYNRNLLSIGIENKRDSVARFIVPSSYRRNGIDVIEDYSINTDTLVVNFLILPEINASGKINYVIDGEYYLQRSVFPEDKLYLAIKVKKCRYKKLSYVRIVLPQEAKSITQKIPKTGYYHK